MTNDSVQVSFEFFPPTTEDGLEKLLKAAEKLSTLKPEFCSVTYGAGGSTQEGTLKTVSALKAEFDISVMPHLSCIGSDKNKIRDLLQQYVNMGINRIIALRGDLPSGARDIGEFAFANELVEFIREEFDDHFDIKVAAYPEIHPEAETPQFDLENFKRKVDAGANAAITQFFFNTDAYFHFLDDCRKANINIPIIPGILPISNWEKLFRFAKLCDAEIPQWLRKRMDSFRHDPEAQRECGLEYMTKICERLIQGGARELHFYTLNLAKLSMRICENLGVLR